jgi:anti-sigma regulatory factor (Ser/Thr protein kinase)
VGRAIHLEIPPRTDYLAVVRRVVAVAAGLDGVLSDRRIDDLSLAVSEACANAIDAQRAAGSDAPVEVAIEPTGRGVAVTVRDHAGGFAPDDVDPLPEAEDPGRLRHERGLGLPLMESLTETVTFTPTADGTAVRLEVVTAPPATGPA